jgi:hypothetical protein
VVSVVIRFEYAGHSILLTGDTLGRHIGDDADACKMAERFMVEHAGDTPIASEVLIGQHHGADNSSSACFLAAVHPTFVVFSAGHDPTYIHPRDVAVRRVLSVGGLTNGAIFRTDRGDDQGKPEWDYLRLRGCHDGPGDDDVDIFMPDFAAAAPIRLAYRDPVNRCTTRATVRRPASARRPHPRRPTVTTRRHR